MHAGLHTPACILNQTFSPLGIPQRFKPVEIRSRRNYIRALNGEISTTEAGKFVWIISTLANLIGDAELEARISAIELDRK